MRFQDFQLQSLTFLCSYPQCAPILSDGTRLRNSYAPSVPCHLIPKERPLYLIDKVFSIRAIHLQGIVEMFIIAGDRNSTQIGSS